jgi:hypothetical protein
MESVDEGEGGEGVASGEEPCVPMGDGRWGGASAVLALRTRLLL